MPTFAAARVHRLASLLALLSLSSGLHGQTTNAPAKSAEPLNWTTQQDHPNMQTARKPVMRFGRQSVVRLAAYMC
jgi:hypothetical protein